MELDHTDMPDHEALFRIAEILEIRANNNLNIKIGEQTFDNVPIHYHCLPGWENESHPHSASEMVGAFSIGDQVVVMCDKNSTPKYVIGFPGSPRFCEPIIILRKLVDGAWDYWYYVVSLDKGYHKDPEKQTPSEPLIFSTWWLCSAWEAAEFLTIATPALEAVSVQGCTSGCGLADIDEGDCCLEGSASGDVSDAWGHCPCGGEWNVGTNDCTKVIDCEPYNATMILGGCKSSYNRVGNRHRECVDGGDYIFSVGGVAGGIRVENRSRDAGSESTVTCVVNSSTCGPYHHQKRCCGGWDEDKKECTGKGDPYYCGEWDCMPPQCTNWASGPPGAVWRWTVGEHPSVLGYGGCLEATTEGKSSAYSTESGDIITQVTAMGVTTEFAGGYDHHWSKPGTISWAKSVTGYHSGQCQACNTGFIGSGSYTGGTFTFNEESYGAGGWRTVVASDGRIAVLIPWLSASASVSSVNGAVSGSVESTTVALLRIVDAGEHDFNLASADNNYSIYEMPGSRTGLGLQPKCWAVDVPTNIELRGLHWHEGRDWILAAFVFDGIFEAALMNKADGSWGQRDLSLFKSWVGVNNLEDYTMYLA